MISLSKAKNAIEASEKKAQELGIKVSTVIVDANGVVIAMSKMDGAIPISPKFAYAKAYTSANLGFKTNELAPNSYEGKPYFGMQTLFAGELTTISGGVPVFNDEKLIGGIGVGGSADTNQDLECAQEALKVLG